jgi:hypothetical protein
MTAIEGGAVGVGWCGAVVVVAALLAGCTAATDGSAVPAADLGHDPQPVQVAALDGLLLPTELLNLLIGATGPGLVVNDSGSRMHTGHTEANDCAGTWRVAWAPVYDGNGWTAMRDRNLFQESSDGDTFEHKLWQAVVAFPLPVDANAFYAKQAASWRTCNDRRVNERDVDDPTATDSFWKLGEATDNNGMLTIVTTEEDAPVWACETALTIRNNVAVTAQVCGDRVTTQADTVVNVIAQKVPVQ